MIITETTEKYVHTYSDAGMKIRQIETGIIYDEAWDVKPVRYTYEETDEPIELTDDATQRDGNGERDIMEYEMEGQR